MHARTNIFKYITSHKKYAEGITLSSYSCITSEAILTTDANVNKLF